MGHFFKKVNMTVQDKVFNIMCDVEKIKDINKEVVAFTLQNTIKERLSQYKKANKKDFTQAIDELTQGNVDNLLELKQCFTDLCYIAENLGQIG